MYDFFLKVALPPNGIPKKIQRLLKDAHKSEQKLYVYLYQERNLFKAKVGPRKKDRYMETSVWMIISSKPVADYDRRKWNENS